MTGRRRAAAAGEGELAAWMAADMEAFQGRLRDQALAEGAALRASRD